MGASTMFVDASAIVAVLCDEPDGPKYARELQNAVSPITSPVALFEATAAIRRVFDISIGSALHSLTLFVKRAELRIVPIDEEAHLLALAAFERFGKGMGGKAQLNMGDCFAYAVARQHGVGILYKGDDFAYTDLA